jgi:hypothetical protein
MNDPIRKFVIKEPGQDDRDVALVEGAMTIGRSRSCTVRIEDPAASRIHCNVDVQGDQVWLTDNASTIGTQLNQKKITGKVSLADGDIITVGVATLRCVLPAAGGVEDEAMSHGGETRMAPPGMAERAAPAVQEERDTGGMMFEGTRMLDASELRGLKAGTAEEPTRKKSVLGIVMVLILLGGLGLFVSMDQDTGSRPTTIDVIDNDFAFRLRIPDTWSKVKVADALVAYRGPESEGEPQLVVYADRHRDNSVTPMRIGFEDFAPTLRGTPREWTLAGQRKMMLNDVAVMFFGYSRPGRQGKGIYLLNGEDRIVVEVESSRDQYLAWSDRFSTILQSFTLFRTQQSFDLEPVDRAIRERALADPAKLLVDAQGQYDLGVELLRKRHVKLENTYRAVQSFATAARMTYALSNRPELYEKAVTELLHAQGLFNESVKNQNFEITLAYRQREFDTVYWEALKLMQMVPEKAHPAYQEAQNWLKRVPAVNRR